MLNTLQILQVLIFGLCMGSFFNVVIYRLPNDLSVIKPRSFCPSCKSRLSWIENIPIFSWIRQKGRCINCGDSIPIKYPLIELLTGFLFVIFTKSSPTLYTIDTNLVSQVILSWVFLSLLICIIFIDISNLWIPQVLIKTGFVAGLLLFISLDVYQGKFLDQSLTIKSLCSSVISFFIFESFRKSAKYIFKKDAIGKGDSKLVAMISLWLGPLGTLFAVGIAYLVAAIFCLVGLSLNLMKFRQYIPFAPFLSLGGLLVWFFGNQFFVDQVLRIYT